MKYSPRRNKFKSESDVVRKYLFKSGIRFEENFRIFPLESADGSAFDFIPCFCLRDIRYKNKRILIEPHTNLRSKDVPKFRLFLDTYGRLYHLIVLVSAQQLRDWNWYDREQAMFHDIWMIDNMDFFIKHLQSLNRP